MYFNMMSNPAEIISVLLLIPVCAAVACPDKCVCDENILSCIRPDIPMDIPLNIIAVYLTVSRFDSLKRESFPTTKWENVTFLDLHVHAKLGNLQENMFLNLKHLKHLGLHCDDLWNIPPSVFHGLDKVQTLDMSNNYRLKLSLLQRTWDRRWQHVLPSLENLTLSNLNSRQTDPLNMEYEFMKSLSYNRTLRYLDISYTNIATLDFNQVYLLCNSIVKLTMKGIVLAHPKGFHDAPNCASLRTLDITDTVLPVSLQTILTFESVQFNCNSMNVYNSIETLIGNGLSANEITIESYHLNMTDCGFHMKNIIMRRNHFKRLNLTVTLPKNLRSSISELDCSENSLEYVDPRFIYPSENLQILRMSKNNLYVMQMKHWADFASLLKQSRELKEFYIAENKLLSIPRNFFDNNNKIEYIDMSNNKLGHIEFDIRGLVNLKYLDLSHNLIKLIERHSILQFNDLISEIGVFRQQSLDIDSISRQQTSTRGHMKTTRIIDSVLFQVNLGYNPYECSCKEESDLTLEWLQSSIAVDRKHATYICEFQGRSLDILSSATAIVEAKCDRESLMNILKIAIPIIITVIILVILALVFIRRRQRIKQRHRNFLSDVRMGKLGKQFLVFLSFCSEDEDFVMEHLYPQLQHALSKLTNDSKNLVCIGDREFRLGLTVHAEIMRCMEESSVVVFVVSKQFCRKSWCQMEVGEAYDQRKPILMFMKEFVEIKEMPKVLGRLFKRYTHASWISDDNGGRLEPNINIISNSILELARTKEENNAHLDPAPRL